MINLILAIGSLILAIMTLTTKKFELFIKIVICCYLSTFVFSWLFFDFNFWWDTSNFSPENLKIYTDNHIFYKAIICLCITWFSINFLCRKILLLYYKTNIANRIQILYENPKIKDGVFNFSIKLMKKYFNSSVYTANPEDVDFEYIKYEIVNKLSIMIQLMIVWLTLSKFYLWEYIIFIIICIIILTVYLFTPSMQSNIPNFKKFVEDEYNTTS